MRGASIVFLLTACDAGTSRGGSVGAGAEWRESWELFSRDWDSLGPTEDSGPMPCRVASDTPDAATAMGVFLPEVSATEPPFPLLATVDADGWLHIVAPHETPHREGEGWLAFPSTAPIPFKWTDKSGPSATCAPAALHLDAPSTSLTGRIIGEHSDWIEISSCGGRVVIPPDGSRFDLAIDERAATAGQCPVWYRRSSEPRLSVLVGAAPVEENPSNVSRVEVPPGTLGTPAAPSRARPQPFYFAFDVVLADPR
jgi:hypothetical protein